MKDVAPGHPQLPGGRGEDAVTADRKATGVDAVAVPYGDPADEHTRCTVDPDSASVITGDVEVGIELRHASRDRQVDQADTGGCHAYDVSGVRSTDDGGPFAGSTGDGQARAI